MCAARELQVRQLISRYRESWRKGSFLAELKEEALEALLLAGLEEAGTLERLVAGRPDTRLEAGKKLIVEGDPADDVFLLVDAVVAVTVRPGKPQASRIGWVR